MIDPDHINTNVKRIVQRESKLAGVDESESVAKFHSMSLMATYYDWSEFFTFVALTEDLCIDHYSVDVSDLDPAKWIGIVVEEAIRLQNGRYIAVSLNMGAYTMSLGWHGETRKMESKYCFTVPATGNIVVSKLHRDLETKVMDNGGKWESGPLQETTLDPDGNLEQVLTHLQEVIQEERENRN